MAWIVARRFKTGTRYYVRYSIQGRKAWFSAGRSRLSAEKIRAKIEAEIAEGRFLDKKAFSDWTLSRLKTLYLERMDALKPKSAAWRRDRFNQLEAVIGPATRIEGITLETLDRYVHARLAAGRAIATVNGEVAIIRHALGQAHRWQAETGLSEYRLKGWKPLKGRPKADPVFLSRPDVRRLLEAARRRGGAGYVFLRVFLATGARPAEILALGADSLDGTCVRFRTLKGGHDRTVDLGGLCDELRATLPFQPDGYRRFWRCIRKDTGLNVRLYDLRHTAISEMLRRGMTLREVQRLIGHTTSRMTERYAHYARAYKPPKALRW